MSSWQLSQHACSSRSCPTNHIQRQRAMPAISLPQRPVVDNMSRPPNRIRYRNQLRVLSAIQTNFHYPSTTYDCRSDVNFIDTSRSCTEFLHPRIHKCSVEGNLGIFGHCLHIPAQVKQNVSPKIIIHSAARLCVDTANTYSVVTHAINTADTVVHTVRQYFPASQFATDFPHVCEFSTPYSSMVWRRKVIPLEALPTKLVVGRSESKTVNATDRDLLHTTKRIRTPAIIPNLVVFARLLNRSAEVESEFEAIIDHEFPSHRISNQSTAEQFSQALRLSRRFGRLQGCSVYLRLNRCFIHLIHSVWGRLPKLLLCEGEDRQTERRKSSTYYRSVQRQPRFLRWASCEAAVTVRT